MAGQPVMPGQPAVVPQPAQPTTTVTGVPMLEGTQGPGMLSVEELAVNPSNITGGGQPQKDVTQSVAPIQQTAFPTGTAGQQTAGAYDMMANGAVRQPGKLAAVASDMLARFGETGLIRMTSGNKAVPVAREYLRRKAAGEDVTMLKVAEDITGVSETGKTMDENQRKFEISNRAKNAETQRIADRATRDAEAAEKEQKAQWRTTATNMDSDIAKAIKGGTNEKEIQDNIKGYFDTLTAMNYPMDKLRGTAKTIWNRVQKAISEGKTGEELNRAYYTEPKAPLDAGLETALIKNVTTMFEGRLDPNASMTEKDKKIGSIFPVKSFEQYKNDKKLQASHRINSQQDFEKELYNTGIGGGQSMKAAFDDFVKKVRNNSPKKSKADAEENALRLWKQALLTDESLNHAWMVNSNDDVSKQERQKPVESPNAPTGPAFTGNDAAGNAGLPAQPVAEAAPQAPAAPAPTPAAAPAPTPAAGQPGDYAAQRAATKDPVALAQIDETQAVDIWTRMQGGLDSKALDAEIRALPPSAARAIRNHLLKVGYLTIFDGYQYAKEPPAPKKDTAPNLPHGMSMKTKRIQ